MLSGNVAEEMAVNGVSGSFSDSICFINNNENPLW
jgi:hypothetical protein